MVAEIIQLAFSNVTALPIQLVSETRTVSWQFYITLLISSLFIFWFFGTLFVSRSRSFLIKMYLRLIKMIVKRRILLIKHTDMGLFSLQMIDVDSLRRITRALMEFKNKPFDLILHTPGGELFAALHLSRLLRDYPSKIRTIIPFYAMSAGTLLSLSTNEIILGPNASLGPIDPQVGTFFKYGSAKSWDKIVRFKGKKADDSSIAFQLLGKQATKTMKDYMYKLLENKLPDDLRRKFINRIVSGEVEHSYPLTYEELMSYGLPVNQIKNKKILNLIYKIIRINTQQTIFYV